jgi:pimeloyl-ACP methyl ester carboxylesterase
MRPNASPSRTPRRSVRITLAAATALALAVAGVTTTQAEPVKHSPNSQKPTIVLVHGAWADSSSWSGEIGRLQSDGYPVIAAPNPLRGLSNDSATLADLLSKISGLSLASVMGPPGCHELGTTGAAG